jgi:acyl-CoA synthetase (AMP-forming)/AMP-acid ligase II
MTLDRSPPLPKVIAQVARNRPAATALVARGSTWSYAQLADAMWAVSARLAESGARPGSRIGLLFRNSPQYVAAYYGVLQSGCVAVPLNPHEHAGCLARQMSHCDSQWLIADGAHPERPLLESLSGVESIVVEAGDGASPVGDFIRSMGGRCAGADIDLDPDSLAAIAYTSGTTGSPKGVMLSHNNLTSNAVAIAGYLALDASDCGVAVLPLQFAYGNSVLHSHLVSGARLLLEESFAYPHAVLRRMADEGATGFSGVPSTFSLLMARCDVTAYALGRLRYLTQAGGPMPVAEIRRLQERLPHVQIYLMYGQTEATARLSYLPPERVHDKAGSVGIPIPGVELAVLRTDGGLAVAGEVGEIVARGPNIMLGYLHDPAATSAALRDGWLRTGDSGHFDRDGFLYIDGRAAEMIKVGAFRISPYEIEEVISAIDGVAEVAVTSVPDAVLGQAIKAVIVPLNGMKPDPIDVKAHCRRHLAAYKVPKLVEFVSALPHTSTGKVQRRLLA